MTFHGHDHVYERTCPVYNGTCQPNLADGSLGGPVHVVIGNAGFSLSYLPNPYIPPYWEVHTPNHLCSLELLLCQRSSDPPEQKNADSLWRCAERGAGAWLSEM